MFRVCGVWYGGGVRRKAATVTATAASRGMNQKKRGPKPGQKMSSASSSVVATPREPRAPSKAKLPQTTETHAGDEDGTVYASARPAYMSEKREKEVLRLAERMQGRDLSGEVPVASFAYEIIQKHPSVRTMGLRERMDFLCTRWAKLPEKKRLEYLNDPLKGLL